MTAGVVEVEDDGIGLDEERIAACLSRIGFSSKTGDDGLLGRFGIGLLSGFLVAHELVVETRKKGGSPLRWTATRDGGWKTEPCEREAVGTCVRLVLDEQHRRYADKGTLRSLLEEYVPYLPFAVHHDGELVTRPAPWRATDPAAVKEWLEARGRRPLAVFPVTSGSARGFLFVTDDRSSEDGGRVDVYLGGMLLERGARRLLPRWASFASGLVEAQRIAPTASRETFVEDEAAEVLREEVRGALVRGLAHLAQTQPRIFDRVLSAHALSMRGACVDVPELMEALGDHVPFDTNVGVADLRTVSAGQPDRTLRYVETPQDFAHTAPLASAQGLALVNASYVYDVAFLKAWAALRGYEMVRLTGAEVKLLVQPAHELLGRFTRVMEVARRTLQPFDVAPELGRFEPGAIPAFVASDAMGTKERARTLVRESESPLVRSLLSGLSVVREADGTRFILNANSHLVAALPDVRDEERLSRVLRLLYLQAAMVLRRTLSIAETRAFSDDLLALAMVAVTVPRGDLN
jgi:molecular chaperone HtpG